MERTTTTEIFLAAAVRPKQTRNNCPHIFESDSVQTINEKTSQPQQKFVEEPDAIGEVEALGVMVGALKGFDEPTCARMLDYLADRFASCVLVKKHKEPVGLVRLKSAGLRG
jgi:hypothetical protein